MATLWENVVTLAREIDAAFSKGQEPDTTMVSRLARAVVEFQRELTGRVHSSTPPPREGETNREGPVG